MISHYPDKDGAGTLCGLSIQRERYRRLWIANHPEAVTCARCERSIAKAEGQQ